MSENPYQSPLSETPPVQGVLSGTREDLRKVATAQKGILVCILINILTVVAQMMSPPDLKLMFSLPLLVVGLVATVFVFMLAIRVYGRVVGIVLGILAFIPFVGFIVLLVVNGKATSVLQLNGIKVGLLGAKLSKI